MVDPLPSISLSPFEGLCQLLPAAGAQLSAIVGDGPDHVPRLTLFRRQLGALLATFQTLCPDDRTKAVSMMREAVGRMQAVVKYQLCNDALRTVAALAENMIQEAYGFATNQADVLSIPSASPVYVSGDIRDQSVHEQGDGAPLNESSIDNDLLTNALYATLQAVNPCELSPPDTSSADDVPPAMPASRHSPRSPPADCSTFDAPPLNDESPVRSNECALKCSQCDYVAKHRQNLHRHQKLHQQRRLPLEQGRPFACGTCGRRFGTKWAVKEHTKYKHSSGELATRSEGQDGLYQTGHCQDARATASSPNFQCDYCEKVFPFRNGLKRHIDSVHFKSRHYECSQCGKAFANSYHLKRHVECVHMELRSHQCPRCGRAFSTPYHLNRHVKNVHS